MSKLVSLEQLETQNGQEVGLSDWLEISQSMIDDFAKVVEDFQYIHIDPERATKSPFGGTIAHGFLTLSLIEKMGRQCLPAVENSVMTVNYGCDKLRFIHPVPSGASIRGRFMQTQIENKPNNRIIIHHKISVEIEGFDKPALIADWLMMHAFG